METTFSSRGVTGEARGMDYTCIDVVVFHNPNNHTGKDTNTILLSKLWFHTLFFDPYILLLLRVRLPQNCCASLEVKQSPCQDWQVG